MTTSPADKPKSYFPLAGGGNDGWGPGLVNTFVCNCADCRKITASMFASNFTIADTHLTHVRGRENLTAYGQSRTIASGSTMTNYFCKTCGTLMYRVSSGSPGMSILRIGTVDDFNLHETKLKPAVEQFIKTRVGWLHGVEGTVADNEGTVVSWKL
ncbi:Mss4-like protein [Mycena olivaceomarginata]|nr:Mss4-like protein [Mycena olivaceomarginata]